MFKCDVTGKITEPGEKCHKVVSAYRRRATDGGLEIIKELNVSTEGLEILKSSDFQPSTPISNFADLT